MTDTRSVHSSDTGPDLPLSPQPGAASRGERWRAQASLEWRMLMTNGEQLLLTLVIPLGVLVAVTALGLADVDQATPGVMSLAVLSSAFTATAIATGFERRSAVLKYLGSTPLGRSGLLVGKVAATLGVVALQLALISLVARYLRWTPTQVQPLAAALLVGLGVGALGAWGFALAGLLRAEATLAVANGIFLLLLFAGGTVLPVDRLPAAVAAVVSLLPSAALGEGLRAVLDTGGPILAHLLVLAGWAAAGTFVAIRTFRWE